MKKIIVLIGCAALMGTATSCKDQTGQNSAPPNSPFANRGQNPNNRSPGASPMQTPTNRQQSATTPSQTATSPGQNATELAGTLKSVDKDKRSLTIAPASGGQQDVKLADSVAITRDGNKIDLDQLRPGDEVRASFDPATKQASTITVQSNETNKAK
jgi:hypothetical protein